MKTKLHIVIIVTLSLVWLILPQAIVEAEGDYYVDVINGDDSNPGTLDKPFRTIQKARDTIRETNAKGITVYIRKGVYYLSKPLEFNQYDSGNTYRSYPGEKVIISGGKLLSTEEYPWEIHQGNIYKCDVGEHEFRSLWVDGKRAIRAREPDEDPGTDYLDYYISTKTPDASQAMGFSDGDINENWTNFNSVEVQFLREFTSPRKPIAYCVNNAVWFSKPVGSGFCYFYPGNRYWVENVFEGLDEPGEWYLNTNTNELYYYPVDGKNPNTSTIIAGNLGYYASRLVGTLVHITNLENVTFQGLIFSHGDWYISSNGWSGFDSEINEADGSPSWIGTGPAVFARPAINCLFVECAFVHIGGHAIHMYGYNNNISRCVFSDIGASAIHISAGSTGTSGYSPTYNITIADNMINNYGVVFPAGKGIVVGRAHDILVTHNSVSDGGNMGIQMGGGGTTDLQYNNTVTYNDVSNVCNLLHDASGIYGGGTQTNSIFSYNKVHDIKTARSPIYDDSGGYGKGLYLDESCDNIVVEKNWVYRVPWGMLFHLTENNILRNNVFADITGFNFVWFSGSNDQVTQNIYYNTREITYLYKSPVGLLDYNLFYNIDNSFQTTWDAKIDNIQAQGFELHSMEQDPLFVDFQNDNFNLRANSPAFALGFEDFDMSNVGPRANYHPEESDDPLEKIEPEKIEFTCYNNVFNPTKGEKALIKVEIQNQSHVRVNLYNTRGNKIKELADEEKEPGTHKYYWDGKSGNGDVVGSGLYFVHIQAGDYKKTKKIVVVK